MSVDSDGSHGPKDGEVIPPTKADSDLTPSIYAEIAAQINQYTDRPDLLLEVVEKHDPGFVKEMNNEARQFSRKYRTSRFRFGRVQSYTGLAVSVGAAALLLYVIYLLAMTRQLGFWNLVALGIVFAIAQSGTTGFLKVVNQIADIIKGTTGKS